MSVLLIVVAAVVLALVGYALLSGPRREIAPPADDTRAQLRAPDPAQESVAPPSEAQPPATEPAPPEPAAPAAPVPEVDPGTGPEPAAAPAAPSFKPPPAITPAATPAPRVPPTTAVPTPRPAPAPLPVDKPKLEPTVDPRAAERARIARGLAKTRGGFVAKLARLFRGKPRVDESLQEQIEEVLFTADIGAATAQKLLEQVTASLDKKEVADPDAVWDVIRSSALDLLDRDAPAEQFSPTPGPYVLLMIGVNGVGKTTTLGKLAAMHAEAGRKVLLVAGDTFRAAATEQLDVWARRVGCDIHTGADKADPSSVIFDGILRGRKEGHDIVLCDTAGRLHTRKELMDELSKVGRACGKALRKDRDDGPDGAHDIFLVLDATIGQNALAQAKLFKETLPFTGLVVTKLDGTAKGGVVLGVCDELGVPIRYIGIGESISDLRPFDPEAFVDALLHDRDGQDLVEA